MGLKPAPTRALVVPDEESWLVWGHDLRADRFQPVDDPGRAEELVVSERVPAALETALHHAWMRMPPRRRVRTLPAPIAGEAATTLLEGPQETHAGEHSAHGQDGHEGHQGHGHMMAITGEPSRDGLVMESIDVVAGPLGVALPSGLVVEATLDGDVVERCEVRATLRAGSGAPDPLVPEAWAMAEAVAAGRAVQPSDLAAFEVERALSHLAWLHHFLRLLGWAQAAAAIRPLVERARRVPAEAADDAWRLAERLETSRLFARRTEGVGALSADDIRARRLAGPVARASGVEVDARGDDHAYRLLGFEHVIRGEGDVRARALVRAREAARSLEYAARATTSASVPPRAVEGPRGPLEAGSEPRAAGQREAVEAAAELAVGYEWATALVVVASFDLSPWQVGR